jgi:hypothetical protein
MRVATASATMMSAAAGHLGRRAFPGVGRGEGGKLLVQLGRTAMRAFCPAPVGRADQDFAVLTAFTAMKFVEWHRLKITGTSKMFKRRRIEPGKLEFAKESPVFLPFLQKRAIPGFAFSFNGQHLRCCHESFATRH